MRYAVALQRCSVFINPPPRQDAAVRYARSRCPCRKRVAHPPPPANRAPPVASATVQTVRRCGVRVIRVVRDKPQAAQESVRDAFAMLTLLMAHACLSLLLIYGAMFCAWSPPSTLRLFTIILRAGNNSRSE